MATWPQNPRLIGTRITRVDGLAKASGQAKYPSDVRPQGTLFGVMLYSPYAHATVKSIDISAAEKMPGVKAVIAITAAGKPLRYHGDDIAAVAAETEEQARDAIRAIKVEYEVLPHVATEALSMAQGAPVVFKPNNVRAGRGQTKGKPEEAMSAAEVTSEGTYSVPLITHVCLEPHGLTVLCEGDNKMEAWASTQNVHGIAGELGGSVEPAIPATNVTVHTDFMGGGFGSKFSADLWGRTAAKLSKKVGGRPVKMFLDRVQEHLAAGNRPSGWAHIKLGANRDGKVRCHDRRGTRHHGGDQSERRRDLAVRLQRSQHVRRAINGHDHLWRQPRCTRHRGILRAACSPKRPWMTSPTSWVWIRSSFGSRTLTLTISILRSTRPN